MFQHVSTPKIKTAWQFVGHHRNGRGRREPQLRGIELKEPEVVHRVPVDLGGSYNGSVLQRVRWFLLGNVGLKLL